MRSFSVLFSLQFDEGYTMVGLKIFKPCINIRFVSIVYRSVAQPRFWGPHAALFQQSPNILCNRLRSTIKQNVSIELWQNFSAAL